MTMVPSAQDDRTQLCTRHHHHYSYAAGYGGEIESVRRRFSGIYHHRSTSSSPTSPAVAAYCIINNNNSQADRAFCNYIPADEMRDRDDFRPENDPNQPSSSSMDPGAKRVEDSWLRLRLGGGDQTTSGLQSQAPQSAPDRRGLVELDLLPGSSRATNSHHEQPVGNTGPQALFQAQEFRAPPRPVAWLPSPAPEINWALMRPGNIMAGQQLGNYYVANPSMSLMPTGANFFARPAYGYQMGLNNGGGDPGGGTSSSSSGGGGGMRIVRPPRRPHVGVWFRLQASQNQVREPFLPQIPKSYLRIKDGRMTVRLLIKYLVHKLRLEGESEVEIRCRGEELQPVLTLQHVRDNIWCSRRDAPLTLLPDSSTTFSSADSHIMILHYARPVLAAVAATTTTRSTPLLSTT